jgi:hypothetical protein
MLDIIIFCLKLVTFGPLSVKIRLTYFDHLIKITERLINCLAM